MIRGFKVGRIQKRYKKENSKEKSLFLMQIYVLVLAYKLFVLKIRV